jgi:5-methylcytosine-specific restriction enzyme A
MHQWIATSKPGKRKGNPRFAFEWAFIAEDRFVILSLWYRDLTMSDNDVICIANFRRMAGERTTEDRISKRAARAMRADQAVRDAFEQQLPIRVIMNDGSVGQVQARDLDPASWKVTGYCVKSGEFELSRDSIRPTVVRRRPTHSIFFGENGPMRSDHVREQALQRARGRCEYCGSPGFRTRTGTLYLETHHIEPLAEGGADHETNVIALCPGHHREAHFGFDSLALREKFMAALSAKPSQRQPHTAKTIQSGFMR